jgi:hypothetical protein
MAITAGSLITTGGKLFGGITRLLRDVGSVPSFSTGGDFSG